MKLMRRVFFPNLDFKSISKKYNELFKRYEEKSAEIRLLKEKLGEIVLKENLSTKHIETDFEDINFIEETETNKNRMIKSMI
jgi:hypothetical protein